MIREWLLAHRNTLAAGVSGTVIVGVIGAVAIVSGGYTAQRIDLGDGSVWVTNASRQVVGRANTQVFELNTVVDTTSNTFDLAQRGSTVLVTDSGSSAVDIVDAATSDVKASVPLPPDDPHVALAGSDVVITADGDVWTSPLATLSDFQSASQPKLSLGTGTITSIDGAGRLFAFTPATGLLVQIDVATGATSSSTTIPDVTPDDTFSLTSVGDRWVLLDSTTGTVDTASGRVSLGSGNRDGAVLQQPSGVEDDTVLVAHSGGLLGIPLGGGQPRSIVDGRSGTPAAPMVLDGCAYAAWADGTVWQRCGDHDGATASLDGASGALELAFRSNNHSVVLNDTGSGATWAVQDDNRLIDNWDELINAKRTDQVVEENDQNTPPELEKTQQPPVAVDDQFGARPGRSTLLPVLLNDFDPNGDVLVVSAVTGPDAALGRVDAVANGQQLQLTLPADASGQVRFGYTITDGRGGSASASVTVEVRTPDENSPPKQVRTTRASVETGGRVTTQVMSDWVDPDGDAMYLAGASSPAPDVSAFKPDGTVVFSDVAGGSDSVAVGLTVSDGRAEGAGTLTVAVMAVGTVPIVAEAFIVPVTAGQEVTVSPLDHVRGGNGAIRLSSVPAKPDVTITPDFDGGTFRFSSGSIGTHYLEYSVTDGASTTTGVVRVDVAAPPNGPTTPITVPHTAYVHTQSTATIDPVATDIDPTGGVLLVTGVTTPGPASGFRVEILEQHLLRITLTGPLDGGQATFGYRVSNGLAEADGSVTVIEVPRPERRQAPIARPDTAAVRVGDVIDIPVLDNDEQPDGDPLTLDANLGERPSGSGLLFASGRVLRYLAPSQPGNYTAVYRVDAPDGQFASAEVKISVREADPASNNPPVPRTVVARVLAGEKVRIPIPLSGIDPDGDSVQLLGQETNPQKGSVIDSGPGWLDYQSGEYSGGTDTFNYAVIDSLGARAIGIIRVGISARLDGSRSPVAAPDTVTARPGGTVLARVLDNDSDPDGGTLTITSVKPTTDQGKAVVDGDLVRVTVPKAEGDYGFIYTVQNALGGTSSNFLTVRARTDAPLSRPIASDTVLTLSDVLDRTSVDVDVLANVFFADGPASSLKLSLLPGYDTASVTKAGKVRVRIGDDSQIIPFAVAHPQDPSIVGYAFIWVPGYNDALPQLRKGVASLSVVSEAALEVDINKYVVAVGGKAVRLTDSGTVRASHGNGSDLVIDDTHLRFTSAPEYFGPASISFEVTDGASADDPKGRTATIVLPITVTPRQNQPPAFTGGVIDFEPEQSKVINLTRLTNYPYPDDRGELTYTVLDPPPVGFTVALDGQSMKITADSSAQKGAQTAVTVGVRDDLNAGTAGRILLRVVPSTRPIAVPAPDSAIAPRGQTTTVDVLANDAAGNPFPSRPLTVLAVRGLDAASLPSGVSIVPSADRSSLRVTVSSTAAPVDTNLQYQVADATGDPDRYAWGTVRISVQDRPDPVTALSVTGYADKSLTVAFQPAAFNNSPISGYTVSLLSASTGAPVGSAACASTTCVVPTPGNGDANAVRVQVVATNGIGDSDPTLTPDAVWSDIVPTAPTGITAAPLDGGLRIGWDAVAAPAGATPVTSYVVTVAGTALGEFTAADVCAGARCSIDQTGLANGSSVPFTVSARNGAYPALSAWTSASGSGVPFGPPIAGGISVVPDPASGSVTVTWDAFNGNGDPVNGYFVQRLADGVPAPGVPSGAGACTVTSPAPGSVTGPSGNAVFVGAGTSTRLTGLTGDNTTYNVVVWGFNRSACVPTAVGSSVVRPGPGDITGVSSQMVDKGYSRDLVVDSVSSAGGASRFTIRLIDAGGAPIAGASTNFNGQGTPRVMFSRPWGESIRFQVRACSAWGTCGNWSRTLPDDPQPSLTWELPSAQYDPASATWSWTNAPDNGVDHPASFSCGVDGQDGVPAATATSCIIAGVLPGQPVWLGITIDGTTKRYSK